MVALQRQIKRFSGASIVDALKRKHGIASSTVGVCAANVSNGITMKAGPKGLSHITAIATTDDVDLDREVVLPAGMDAADYMKRNQNLFVDHTYFIDCCVGKMRHLQPWAPSGKMRGHKMVADLMPDEANPYAKAVRALIAMGGCGVSIGFEALDWGSPTKEETKQYPGAESIVRKWRLLEVSFTAMPCNVACQTQEAAADEGKAWAAKSALAPLGDGVVSAFGLAGLVEAPKQKPQRIVVWVD